MTPQAELTMIALELGPRIADDLNWGRIWFNDEPNMDAWPCWCPEAFMESGFNWARCPRHGEHGVHDEVVGISFEDSLQGEELT